MKKFKMDWRKAAEQRLTWLNELDEFLPKAYESSALYKEKMKKYHDLKIEKTRVYGRGYDAFIQFQVALVSGQAQVQMDWPLLAYPTIGCTV